MKKGLFILLLMFCSSIWSNADNKDVITGNAFDRSVSFSNSGVYEWIYDENNQRLQSSNKGRKKTDSYTTITIGSGGLTDVDLTFDYKVSSESTYDKLTITLDGKTIVNGISGVQNGSYKGVLSHYSSHTLVLSYTKDESGDYNDDRAYISNLRMSSGTCGEGVTWDLGNDGTLTISGKGSMYNYSWSYHNNEEDYYDYNSPFASHGSHYNNKATGNFGHKIKSVVFGKGVTNIGDHAFYGCNLTSVETKDVTIIGAAAFEDCKQMTNAYLLSPIKTIGHGAFFNCEKLETVNISSLENWLDISFSSGESNPLHYAKHLKINNVDISEIKIPSTIKEIKPFAFHGFLGLKKIDIPSSVTSIKNDAFYNCRNLAELSMGPSVSEIGYGAFSGCSNLTSIDIPASVTTIGTAAFYGCM